MPKVKYIEKNGCEHIVDVAVGTTVMQGAVDNLVEGIVAECGGLCSCATCHCYVDESWLDKVGESGDIEREMLNIVFDPLPNSRLSCQIVVSEELDGLTVSLPESQC